MRPAADRREHVVTLPRSGVVITYRALRILAARRHRRNRIGTQARRPDRQSPGGGLHRGRLRQPGLPGRGPVADDRQPRVFHPRRPHHWHSHAVGQTLHVTSGAGLVATRDGTVIRMRPGDTVHTPPGEEHWHGGRADNMMCHLATFEGVPGGDGTTWLEPVTDDQYQAANQR